MWTPKCKYSTICPLAVAVVVFVDVRSPSYHDAVVGEDIRGVVVVVSSSSRVVVVVASS